MRTIFLDTVGLIALWNRSDQWHAAATAAFASLTPNLTRLDTTTYILLECGNEATRRPYRNKVIDLRRDLILSGDLIEPTGSDIDQAWADYEQGLAGQPASWRHAVAGADVGVEANAGAAGWLPARDRS